MNKDQIYMKMALDLAQMSHCVSHKVAAILVRDGVILSTGINGTPKGCKNCDQIFDAKNFDREAHHKFSENSEIHAETNALLFAAKNGINISGSTMYATLHPCNHCMKMLCNSGIKEIIYAEKYDLLQDVEEMYKLLSDAKIKIRQLRV